MLKIQRGFPATIAYWGLKARLCLRSPLGLPVRIAVRRKLGTKLFAYSKFEVFRFGTHEDLCGELELVKAAIVLFLDRSPRLQASECIFKSVIVTRTISATEYAILDRCCLLNPLLAIRHSDNVELERLMLATQLAGSACVALLCTGRFGFAGLRNRERLVTLSQMRFLRRCMNEANHADVLALLSLYSQEADRQHATSHYYKFFAEHDLAQWR